MKQWFLAFFLVISEVSSSWADDIPSQPEPDPDAIDEESELDEESDFPDLIGVDEQGEIVDEFAFLQESSQVEAAARHEQEIGMSPSAITVITRDEIETSGANTIPDLLRMVPGMDVIVYSPYLTSIDARMNYTPENNAFLILVDGKEVNVEFFGMPFWEVIPIFIEDIERIEIIRGPGSSLYGANALAGVVSITTRNIPEENSAWINLKGGQVGNVSCAARGSIRLGQFGMSLGGGLDVSGTYSDPRYPAKNLWKIRSVMDYRFPNSSGLQLDVGFSRGSGEVTNALSGIGTYTNQTLVSLIYSSKAIRGQIFWNFCDMDFEIGTPLEYEGIRLALVPKTNIVAHVLDAEIQWTLPSWWEPLLVIVGTGARATNVKSDNLVDGDTYTDIHSERYHMAGIDHWEARWGGFVHSELSPTSWATLTAGLRFDYNTETLAFISPRFATVFHFVEDQFLRVGIARSFRKPAFAETGLHFLLDYPEDSPLSAQDQERFQEFMSKQIGNSELSNEKLLSFELGYLGQFFQERLQVALDLFYQEYTDVVVIESHMVKSSQGFPDLEKSRFRNKNFDQYGVDVFGGELSVKACVSYRVCLQAFWAHREIFNHLTKEPSEAAPKELIGLGGRLRNSWGLLGSLWIFFRSGVEVTGVPNPAGAFEPPLTQYLEPTLLLLGKLGWKGRLIDRLEVESGVKMLLPISPFQAPYFRFREHGGGVTTMGDRYGADQLIRMVTVYLEAVW